MSNDIIHFCDYPDAEQLYHVCCKRPWISLMHCDSEKLKQGLLRCADGTYLVMDKEKVTCPDCLDKLLD